MPVEYVFRKPTGSPADRGATPPRYRREDGPAGMISPAWRYREIGTNHMIASNRPEELVRLLLELA